MTHDTLSYYKIVEANIIANIQKTHCNMLFPPDDSQPSSVSALLGLHLTCNTGPPQGCFLSPLLYCLYTHDCIATHSSTSIIKFVDDMMVVGLISNNDERAYLDAWCQTNHLTLNRRWWITQGDRTNHTPLSA